MEHPVRYAPNDRYRGIHYARRVVMVNPDDLIELGIADSGPVDLVSVRHDGRERCAEGYWMVVYPAIGATVWRSGAVHNEKGLKSEPGPRLHGRHGVC